MNFIELLLRIMLKLSYVIAEKLASKFCVLSYQNYDWKLIDVVTDHSANY